MSTKLTYVLMVIIVIGAIVWGLIGFNNLARTRSELSLLRTEKEALEINLEAAEDNLAKTERQLTSTQQELDSAESNVSSLRRELNSTESTISSLQKELNSAESNVSSLRRELNSTESTISSLQRELNSAKSNVSSLRRELNSTESTVSSLESQLWLYEDTWGAVVVSGIDWPDADVNLVNCDTASNPTWAQLLDFLLEDKTDQNVYVPNVYVCRHFARDIHNNAERAGIRAAYVVIWLPVGGHALNAFKTTDRGLVFIDCRGYSTASSTPQNWDKIVDVGLGKEYTRKALFPELNGTTYTNMGNITYAKIYW